MCSTVFKVGDVVCRWVYIKNELVIIIIIIIMIIIIIIIIIIVIIIIIIIVQYAVPICSRRLTCMKPTPSSHVLMHEDPLFISASNSTKKDSV